MSQPKVGNLRCYFMFVSGCFTLIRISAYDMRSFFVAFSTFTIF